MAKHIVKLNKDIGFDLGKLIETRLLIQANSGGGKSYAIRRIIEQAFGKVQIIVLDPEGEFTNLRGKFDFIYAGKGGDAPVESRSATLLAHRLLELKASAIIDLYELPPQERKHFVRLFCEAMVNAPKELWHECLIIIDEAHVFAPEKGESEAMGPVIDLATRGRKRGYSVVLATQRLPKLNKDAAAECNNKLIGRASQDIDRKRAAEELGFTTKEQILSLRDLDPGEFYVFGPAISRDVERIRIGEVKVTPPPRGSARSIKAPPPSAAVKRILSELKDLPQEAAQEARTVAELKQLNASLKAENTRLKANPVVKHASEAPMGVSQWRELGKQLGYWGYFETQIKQAAGLEWEKVVKSWASYAKRLRALFDPEKAGNEPVSMIPMGWLTPSNLEPVTIRAKDKVATFRSFDIARDPSVTKVVIHSNGEGGSPLGSGERLVLQAIAGDQEGITTEHIAVLTGYKSTSRRVYLQRLTAAGYAKRNGEKYIVTEEGIRMLGSDYEPLPTGSALQKHLLEKLPEGQAKILRLLLDHPDGLSYVDIEAMTGYKSTSRRVYLQRMGARKIIKTDEDRKLVYASDKLFD